MDIILSALGLTALQIVLGIDNVIFLSIVTSNLEEEFKKKARYIGVAISMVMNAVLVSLAGLLNGMHHELFSVFGKPFNVHDIIMIVGGFFLVFKAVKELYHYVEQKGHDKPMVRKSMFQTVLTMTAIDFVFSIDSTITAIGMSDVRWVQVSATLAAIFCMFIFFNTINRFIEKHPSFKVLALAFLVMIGFSLFVDGMGVELPKAYVYSVMIFAILIEAINIRFDTNVKRKKKVDSWEEVRDEFRETDTYRKSGGVALYAKFYDWLYNNYKAPKKK